MSKPFYVSSTMAMPTRKRNGVSSHGSGRVVYNSLIISRSQFRFSYNISETAVPAKWYCSFTWFTPQFHLVGTAPSTMCPLHRSKVPLFVHLCPNSFLPLSCAETICVKSFVLLSFFLHIQFISKNRCGYFLAETPFFWEIFRTFVIG